MTAALALRYLRNDLRRNRGVTAALLAVLILSSFLMASGAMVMERLAGSVSRLFDTARPPHFLQMHKGDYDTGALERFAAGQPGIEAWLIEEMVGFDGSSITFERRSSGERGDLSASMIDHLFVTQNDRFDFLLDEADGIPRPTGDELYVPVATKQQLSLAVGDRMAVDTGAGVQSLVIAGFVRDAQMASSMSSATRFLVSDEMFARLGAGGSPEIIVEYRLTDTALIGDLQRAYESDPAVPKNGQAVTEVMIRLVNMFSDGLVAVAFVFASLMLIAIALLNVRFVIRGTLEDEVREIGAMRAIGLSARSIGRLYLLRYGALALAACLVGGALAILAVGALTAGIRANFSAAPVGAATVLAPVAALALVFVLVLGLCAGVLRAIGRLDVVGALVHGRTSAPRAPRRTRRSSLTGVHGRGVRRRLVLLDLRAERAQWVLLPVVFFLTAVLITLPTNLLTTFESPRFVTYMGAPESDIRADIQFAADGEDSVDDVAAELLARLRADARVTSADAYAGQLFDVEGSEGWEALRVEVGDYAGATWKLLEGRLPGEGEIALSSLNAEKLDARPGDRITLRRGAEVLTPTVSGVYQDVTSGGFTAKMQGSPAGAAEWWVLYAELAPGVDPGAFAAEYDALSTVASVVPTAEYVRQTLSYVTDALRVAAALTSAFGLGAVALITTLFLRLRLAKDRRKMGVLSALGFSVRQLGGQLRAKTVIAVAAGTALGVAFAASAGEVLVGGLLSVTGMGIARLSFLPNPWLVYLGYPALLLAVGVAAVTLLTARLPTVDRSQWLR
ncbi:MAG: ABC transporter permease [Arachnia sp.]